MLIKASNSILRTGDKKILLKKINFCINKGDFVHILGANGTGKSSLIKAILGYESLNLSSLKKEVFTYSYLPQIENKEFLLPLKLKDLSIQTQILNKNDLELRWNQASGGERKKIMLQRVFEQDFDLYALDEPYNHLDDQATEKINAMIQLKLKAGKTVLLISHKKPEVQTNQFIEMDVNQWSY